MSAEITGLSVRALARTVANGELSALAVAQAFIDRAQQNAAIGAWQHFEPDVVRAQARALDASPTRSGLLAGVPVGVKDLIDTADMPTTYGSPIYRGYRPAMDAACVALARSAGAVLMGKTVTTEFACYTPGVTRNPRSPAGMVHTPGGSSSGSAAAVAAGMVPLAFGTQTAGSIVRPAAFCGVVGYKPSFGTISTAGVRPLAPSLDTVGVLARTVDDAACFVSALTGWMLAPREIDGLRVGVCRTPYWPQAGADTERAMAAGADAFSRMGADVAEMVLPPLFEGLNEAQAVLMAYEAAASFKAVPAPERMRFSAPFAQMIDGGERTPGEAAVAARRLAAEARAALREVLAPFDVVLAPSTTGEAPAGLESTGDPLFCRMWTLLGSPCVHVPTGVGATGMPIGVTIAGSLYGDALVLSAAHALEQYLLPSH